VILFKFGGTFKLLKVVILELLKINFEVSGQIVVEKESSPVCIISDTPSLTPPIVLPNRMVPAPIRLSFKILLVNYTPPT
jgi:hypothetical protein